MLNEDVLNIVKSKKNIEKFLSFIGYNKTLPTILIGCAPCQGFSSHRKKHWGQKEDKRNNLVFAFNEIVKYIDPDVVLMENVPEFLSERYEKYFNAIEQSFHSRGYIIKHSIFNSAEFGVPQKRFRLVIIAMKKDFVMPRGYLKENEFLTVRDAIGHLPPLKAGEQCNIDYMHRGVSHKPSTIEVIKKVPPDGGSRPRGVGPICLDKIRGFYDVYGRLYWDKPSITITHYARNPASGRYTHPEQHRGLTAREAALLQSFPKKFIFEGKLDDIYRQIGEAVPPLLSAGIAIQILMELLHGNMLMQKKVIKKFKEKIKI
jgi:DNA (cytosine-5)-methyltransferase 1